MLYRVLLTYHCLYGCSDERGENANGKNGSEIKGDWRLPGLLYASGLVVCRESEEDLRGLLT